MGTLDTLRLAWQVFKLACRAPGVYARMYLARRRAVGVFRKQLVSAGVDKTSARELAKLYPKLDLKLME